MALSLRTTLPGLWASRPWAYGLAVVATLATLLIRMAIDGPGNPAPLSFMIPIVLAAYVGGFGPALAATFLAVAGSAYFLFPPTYSFAIGKTADAIRLVSLSGTGMLVSFVSGRLRGDRARAEASEQRLAHMLETAQQGEEALRQSEERLQTVIENLSEGIVVSDTSGELVHWNRAGLDMHGFATMEEGLHALTRFHELFELWTLDGVLVPFEGWPLRRILRGEQLRDLDLCLRRNDINWERTFSYGGVLVREPGGRALAVLTITDLTKRRQLEMQLRQTQKMESIGRLAGGVAHDFNNWLTVINGSTDLLGEMLASNPPATELVGEIKHAGERASALTRQLLAFSRREVLEPRVLDLNVIVADTEKMLRRVLGEDIVLSVILSPDVGRVRIDAGQWVQILMNLAVNARDAMPTGGRLTIETKDMVLDETYAKLHHAVPVGRYLLLTVSDTGSGMAPDIASRVFEPFFTTKPMGEGTGLGLSVVHGIVQQSGGHVNVYSEPGFGTTFKLYLPVAGAVPEPVVVSDAVADGHGVETLLLVEDEEAVRRVTSRILRRYGYTVLEAPDGVVALQILEQESSRVALLVTDVVMPHMNGRELAEKVQAGYPAVKVLYTSGYTADAVVRHGVLHAQVAFLQKPHTARALLKKVREVLDGH